MLVPCYVIAFLLGVSLIHCFNYHFNNIQLSILLLIASAWVILCKKASTTVSLLILTLVVGFCYVGFYINTIERWQLPKNLENKPIMIVGDIKGIPEQRPEYTKFEIELVQLADRKYTAGQSAVIQLSWYGQYPQLHTGDRWQLMVKLKKPHGFANPGGINHELHLLQKQIRAVGYVKNDSHNKWLSSRANNHLIDKTRQTILFKIEEKLSNNPYLGFIEALTVGVSQRITQEQWQQLRATGTNHLMVIAGLHIGLITGFIFTLTHLVWRRIGQVALRVPAQQAAAVIALIAGFLYSLLAGFSIPTQRALIMLAVFLLLMIAKRQTNRWQALSLALLVVIIWDPLAIVTAGFWLSFAAVAFIAYGTASRYQPRSLWWKHGRVQWVTALGLLPLGLIFFQQTSLCSILANVIAIPWLGFTVLPVALLGVVFINFSPTLGAWLLNFSASSLSILFKFLGYLATLKSLQWQHAISSPWVLATAIVATLFILAPRGFPGRAFSICWFLPMALWQPAGPKANELWLTVLDVGQGLASIIRTENHVLIYDTGPKYGADFDAGSAIVIPYLRYYGINKLDALILSHGDSDHSGGAAAIMHSIPVKQFYTSVPQRFQTFRAQDCYIGQKWQWDGAIFEFIAPEKGSSLKGNNRSCVLRVTLGEHHIILPGDIEKPAEHYLLTQQQDKLPADILIAPHHGSATSSSDAFVKTVNPSNVIFSTGYLNRFGFPKPQVIARYRAIGAKLINTADCGMSMIKLNANSKIFTQSCHRES